MIVTSIVTFVIGILCILYFAIIVMYAGVNTSFGLFWLVAGLTAFILTSIIQYIIKHKIYINNYIKIGVLILVFSGIIIFFLIEATILYQGNRKPSKDVPYVIVLGAQVRGTTITKSLRHRLDSALSYLLDNPNTKVIVSGGKGIGEDITEARAMKTYLIQEGVSYDRIIEEDQSTNTYENLKFSKKLMKKSTDKVVIITNSFHVFRAISIAKKLDYNNPEGLGANSDRILAVSYYVREAIAIVKDKLVGNM